MEKEIQIYVGQLRAREGCQNTAIQYGYTLRMFKRFLGHDKAITKITKQDVARFLEQLRVVHNGGSPYKRSSIIAVRAALTSFFTYMMETDRIPGNPVPKLARAEVPPRNPIYLLEGEKDRLLAAATSNKEKLIANILISTGMRLSEMLGIRVKDLDFEDGRVQVRLKRGAIRQYVFVHALIHLDIIALMRSRIKSEQLGPDDHLLKLSRRGVAWIISQLAKKAEIPKNISPHKLRHTFAVLLRKRGVHTADLQNLLHHKDRATTAIYEAVDMKDTEDELKRLNLLARPGVST